MKDDTHSLISCDESSNSNDPEEGGNGSDAAWGCGKREEDGPEEAGDYEEDAQATSKDDACTVAVTDGPADEVWVGLAAKRGLDCLVDVAEGGWVGGVLQSLQEDDALAGGEIKLAGSVLDDVSTDYAVNLLTEWLDSDWNRSVHGNNQ